MFLRSDVLEQLEFKLKNNNLDVETNRKSYKKILFHNHSHIHVFLLRQILRHLLCQMICLFF